MHEYMHNRGGLRRPGRGHLIKNPDTPKDSERAFTPRKQRFSTPVDTPTVRKSKWRTYAITPQGFKPVPSWAKKKPPQPSSRVIHVEMLFASDTKTGSPA